MKRIGVIVLAAGGARRFGSAKLLIKLINEKPLIRHIVEIASSSGLSPVICVVGSRDREIRNSIIDLPVKIITNAKWESGISTSVQIGVQSLPDETDACLVLLGDQPFISKNLIHQLTSFYRDSLADIVVPVVNGKRTNPVILDRNVFKAINTLEGDIGAKALFSQFTVEEFVWGDERLVLDIDTLSDLRNAQDWIASTN